MQIIESIVLQHLSKGVKLIEDLQELLGRFWGFPQSIQLFFTPNIAREGYSSGSTKAHSLKREQRSKTFAFPQSQAYEFLQK